MSLTPAGMPPLPKPGKTYASVADPLGPLPTKGKTYAAGAAAEEPPSDEDIEVLPNDPPANRNIMSSAIVSPSPSPKPRRKKRDESDTGTEAEREAAAVERAEKRRRREEREEREERERLEYERVMAEREERRKARRERKERERKEAAASSSSPESGRKFAGRETDTETVSSPSPSRGPEKTSEDAVSNGVPSETGFGEPEHEPQHKPTNKPTNKPDSKDQPAFKPTPQSLVSFTHSVRWAPLAIPLPRRLQTAAVLWHSLSMSLLFGLFWFILAVPLSWPLLVPYLVYIFLFASSHEDGSSPYTRSPLLRRLPLWRAYAAYFPLRLHRTVELDPERNYIFAYHPHGIISHGAFGSFVTEATGFSSLFPGIKNTLLTLDSNFRIPFYREYILALGMASVSRRSCEALLRGTNQKTQFFFKRTEPVPAGGRAITIVVGGARESLEAHPGTLNLVVKRRRGFLKIAMREGAGVVPVLSFGENDLYDQLQPEEGGWVRWAQMGVKKTLGFTLPLIHARGVFNYDVGLMPYRRAVDTVVGKPLFWEEEEEEQEEEEEEMEEVVGEAVGEAVVGEEGPPLRDPVKEKQAEKRRRRRRRIRRRREPTEEDVDAFQRRYISELERMWEKWKDVFAKNRKEGEEGEMRIIE